MNSHQAELDRHFARFESKLPANLARFSAWVRQPSLRLIRVPLALLLIIGGIFSFLPILGLWMLPLGLMLIAQDVPLLRTPVVRLLNWMERKWWEHQHAQGREPD